MPKKNFKVYPENDLVLTDVAVENLWSREYASSTLALSDTLDGSHKVFILEDTLSLVDQVEMPLWYVADLVDTIPITDTLTGTWAKKVTLSQQIGITDTVKLNVHARSVSDALALADTVDGRPTRWLSAAHNLSDPRFEDLTQEQIDTLPLITDPGYAAALVALLASIALRDSVAFTLPSINRTIVDLLQLTSEAAKSLDYSIESHIHLSDTVGLVEAFEQISHVIQIDDSVSATVGRLVSNTLTITDTALFNTVRPRSLSDTILIQDSVSEVGVSHVVHPTHSLVESSNVTFTHPYTTPTFTLQIRSPNLGNNEVMNFRRVKRRDHGGKLEVYRRPIWPKTTRLQLTFSALTEEERFNIFRLFDRSLGEDVGYLDHESRQWRGIFTTPQVKMEEVGPSFNHEITLEFQGVVV